MRKEEHPPRYGYPLFRSPPDPPAWNWEEVEPDDVDRFVAAVLAVLDELQVVNAKKPRWRRAMGVVVFVMLAEQQKRLEQRKKNQAEQKGK